MRVLDANAACLEHPAVENRFGCVFTLRALTIERRHGWRGYESKYKSSRYKHRKPRFRVRQYGCLGALTVVGGDAPQGVVRFVECARIPRGDSMVPMPEPVS